MEEAKKENQKGKKEKGKKKAHPHKLSLSPNGDLPTSLALS